MFFLSQIQLSVNMEKLEFLCVSIILFLMVIFLLFFVLHRRNMSQKNKNAFMAVHEVKYNSNELERGFEDVFESFIHSRPYADTVLALLSTENNTPLDMEPVYKMLYEDFDKYRDYVYAKYRIEDYETDMLILALSGFRRRDMPALLELTPAETRKIRKDLRRKLPFGLYWRVIVVDHALY